MGRFAKAAMANGGSITSEDAGLHAPVDNKLTAGMIRDVAARLAAKGSDQLVSQRTLHHVSLLPQYRSTLKKWRRKLKIPPRWRTDFEIVCPDEMENAFASCRWGYLPNADYFIQIRCDLNECELEWSIAHELLEAIMAPYEVFLRPMLEAQPKQIQARLDREHRIIRDEIIEHFLSVLIGEAPSRL